MEQIIHVIYPSDRSTDFLNDIIDPLYGKESLKINLYRLEYREEHDEFLEKITDLPNQDLYVFLGHGGSNDIKGACTSFCDYDSLVEQNQLELFTNKRVFFLSCRSNEYLKNYGRKCGVNSGIGFPNMITDSYDIDGALLEDKSITINSGDVKKFNEILVRIIKESLLEFAENELTLYSLYHRIKLKAAKELFLLVNSNESEALMKMIRSLKDELYIFGN
jgi:hypothetical protein